MLDLLNRRDSVRQIAYFTPDVRAAATEHAKLFGSGPYYIADNIPLSECHYRGAPGELDHSSAYGQWGEVMIEFVQQNTGAPSVFLDLYKPGESGLHHVALIVDDLDAAMKDYERAGFPAGLYAQVKNGTPFAMMDCVKTYGHFVELYEPTRALSGFYDLVRKAAADFDGRDLLRPISFG